MRGRGGAVAFAPLDEQTHAPDLTALLRLRSGEFKRRYARTALGWRGAAILRRNAAVALGNGLDRAHVPVLGEALRDDPHAGVRGHVAWALGRIGSPRACALLAGARARERDPWVLAEIAAALEPHRRGTAF
jgi:HEAT repeat protein